MIASIAIALLPIERSPMISSRWPRPIGIIASIALMPVCTGSLTDSRATTSGAIRSTGKRWPVLIGPRSSIGSPSGLTTRPISSSPTGTEATSPVVRTSSPSLMSVYSPRMIAPTVSSSRFSARPRVPVLNSMSSEARHSPRPWMRAIPSLASTTVPTLASVTVASKFSI